MGITNLLSPPDSPSKRQGLGFRTWGVGLRAYRISLVFARNGLRSSDPKQ